MTPKAQKARNGIRFTLGIVIGIISSYYDSWSFLFLLSLIYCLPEFVWVFTRSRRFKLKEFELVGQESAAHARGEALGWAIAVAQMHFLASYFLLTIFAVPTFFLAGLFF